MHATGTDYADLDDGLRLVTLPDAARFLSVSRGSLYDLLTTGQGRLGPHRPLAPDPHRRATPLHPRAPRTRAQQLIAVPYGALAGDHSRRAVTNRSHSSSVRSSIANSPAPS